MAFITYRASNPASGPGSNSIKATPLSNAEIDANFKSLDLGKVEITGSAATLTAIPMGNAAGVLAVVNGGTGSSTAATGTGTLVLSTSPILVTPQLGTPSQGILNNCTGTPTISLVNATGLPLGSTGVTGQLTVANGGTGLNVLTAGGIPYASTTTTIATGDRLKFLTASNSLLVNSNTSASPPAVLTGTIVDAHGIDANEAQIVLSSYGGAATAGPKLIFKRTNSTMASPSSGGAILLNDIIGGIGSQSHNGTAYATASSAEILLVADQNYAVGAHGSRIVFNTALNGSTAAIERMRIGNDGKVTVAGNLAVGGVTGGLFVTGAQTMNIVTLNTSGASANNVALDCSLGNYFYGTWTWTSVNANNVNFTFSNVPTSKTYMFMLEIFLNSTYAANNPTGNLYFNNTGGAATIYWANGVVPTVANNKTHIFTFLTHDNGATWRASAQTNYV